MKYIDKEGLLAKINIIIDAESIKDTNKSILAGRILQAIIDFDEINAVSVEEIETYLHNINTEINTQVKRNLITDDQHDYISGYIDGVIDVKNKKFSKVF